MRKLLENQKIMKLIKIKFDQNEQKPNRLNHKLLH